MTQDQFDLLWRDIRNDAAARTTAGTIHVHAARINQRVTELQQDARSSPTPVVIALEVYTFNV